MSEINLKISAITKRIAKLELSKYAYETNGDYTAAALAQIEIILYSKRLDELCEVGMK